MRALRLSGLVLLLLFAYFAQYIFDHGTLAGLYPAWMLARFPVLIGTTLWLPQDLYTLALWLLGGSALLFGLLVPPWPPTQRAGARATAPPATVHSPARPGLTPRLTALTPLLALLGGVALLVGWGWTSLPARIDAQSAAFGVQAQALLAGGGDWLAPGATGAPQLAGLPLALLSLLPGGALAASHLLGLLAALALVAATTVLAAELFVASPHARELGLLAGGFTLCCLASLHFGRLAAWLPATAAGVTGAYLLLAGQRRQQRTLIAASGLTVAFACTLDRSGLVFLFMLLLWWPSLHFDDGRRGRLHLLTWSAGLLAGLLPLLLSWLLDPQAFGLYLHGGSGAGAADWAGNLLTTATTFFWAGDASAVLGLGGPFVASLLAPLFVLACGALLMSIDRPLGWRMLSALAVTLLFASATNSAAPYWPALLPLIPLVGIAITYTLERIGAFWDEISAGQPPVAGTQAPGAGAQPPVAGTQAPAGSGAQAPAGPGNSSTAVLALGLLLAAAAATAVSYYQVAATNGDPPSYTGRALAGLPADAVAVLAATDERYVVRLDDPIVQFAAGRRANQALALSAAALPLSLPSGTLVIVQGADREALAVARSRYPQAALEVVRDLRANPQLYLLRLP